MAARICILDARYALEAVIGNISDEAIFEIVRSAQTLDLKARFMEKCEK